MHDIANNWEIKMELEQIYPNLLNDLNIDKKYESKILRHLCKYNSADSITNEIRIISKLTNLDNITFVDKLNDDCIYTINNSKEMIHDLLSEFNNTTLILEVTKIIYSHLNDVTILNKIEVENLLYSLSSLREGTNDPRFIIKTKYKII